MWTRPARDRNARSLTRVKKYLLAGAAALGAILAGYWAAPSAPTHVLLALTLAVLCVLLACWPKLAIYLSIIVAFAVFPDWVKDGLNVGSLQVPLYEPFLGVAVLYCARKHSVTPYVFRRVLAMSGAVVVAVMLGFALRNDTARNLFEAKVLIDMIAAYYVTAALVRTSTGTTALKVFKGTLWWSAAMTVLGSAHLITLQGATHAVGIFGQYTTATRLQTHGIHPALAVVAACLALWMVGRLPLKKALPWFVPAFIVLILSFQRNSLLGVIAAVVFAIVATRTTAALVNVFLRTMAVVCLALIIGYAAPALASVFPGGGWVQEQVTGYKMEVIGGLSPEAQAHDPSSLGRLVEDEHMTTAIDEQPFIGHGLGFAYQAAFGLATEFTGTIGVYYGHNFWLWWYMKAGLVGAAAWLLFAVSPVVAALKRPSDLMLAAASAGAGLLLVCVFVPLPGDSPSSALIGAVLGLAAGTRRLDRDEKSEEIAPLSTADHAGPSTHHARTRAPSLVAASHT
jgi:O-antigen ligase